MVLTVARLMHIAAEVYSRENNIGALAIIGANKWNITLVQCHFHGVIASRPLEKITSLAELSP